MMHKNSVIYQIVTDRFNNDSDSLFDLVHSPDYNDRFNQFLGGTFKGIERKLDYLKDLGINHILLSPVQASESYHGYDIIDSYRVNPHFGTEQNLKELIDRAHAQEIKVMMDYVPTHVSSRHPFFQEKRAGKESDRECFLFKDLMYKDKRYRSYFDEVVYKLTSSNSLDIHSINESSDYLGYFGLENLPLFNLENPEVVEFHKNVVNYWFEKFGFDNLRLDSGFLQPRIFIKELQDYLTFSFSGTDVITEYWDFAMTGGEGYESSRFYCKGFCNGEIDIATTLEFNFTSHNSNFFKRIMDNYYHFRDISQDYTTVLSISNHDLPRFRGSENLQKILATLQFTLPAIPLIYYGEEIGMQQYNDGKDRIAQSRDVMRFDLFNAESFLFYKKLIAFRKKHLFGDAALSEMQINDEGSLLCPKLKTSS